MLGTLLEKGRLSFAVPMHRFETGGLTFAGAPPDETFLLLNLVAVHLAFSFCGPIKALVHEFSKVLLVKFEVCLKLNVMLYVGAAQVDARVDDLRQEIVPYHFRLIIFIQVFARKIPRGQAHIYIYFRH